MYSSSPQKDPPVREAVQLFRMQQDVHAGHESEDSLANAHGTEAVRVQRLREGICTPGNV